MQTAICVVGSSLIFQNILHDFGPQAKCMCMDMRPHVLGQARLPNFDWLEGRLNHVRDQHQYSIAELPVLVLAK
jgi:hypothetical protein